MKEIKIFFRVVGSLWFATTLLLALMLAMGSATIFESSHGLGLTTRLFYHAVWFKVLLGLFGLNVLASLLVRLPLNRRQIPFALAHVGLICILVGAFVTDRYGERGDLILHEGVETTSYDSREDVVILSSETNSRKEILSIEKAITDKPSEVDLSDCAPLMSDPLTVKVLRYWPDLEWTRQVTNDAFEKRTGVEFSLTKGTPPAWVIAGFSGGTKELPVRVIDHVTKGLWKQATTQSPPSSKRPVVRVTIGERHYMIPMESCMQASATVGDSGYELHVLDYLPHARIGAAKRIENVSDQPVNPAVKIDLIKGDERESRILFSKFPGFTGHHTSKLFDTVKTVFICASAKSRHTPVEFHVSPSGAVVLRLETTDSTVSFHPIEPGQHIETPWVDRTVTLHRMFKNAKEAMVPTMPTPTRKAANPSVEITVMAEGQSQTLWLTKQQPVSFTFGEGKVFKISYAHRPITLGFGIELTKFNMDRYPGGMRPKTFESFIVFKRGNGESVDAHVRMNQPVKFEGWTFFQSSYRTTQHGMISILSITKDPGLPIVYFGYFLTIGGMGIMLLRRTLGKPKKEKGAK